MLVPFASLRSTIGSFIAALLVITPLSTATLAKGGKHQEHKRGDDKDQNGSNDGKPRRDDGKSKKEKEARKKKEPGPSGKQKQAEHNDRSGSNRGHKQKEARSKQDDRRDRKAPRTAHGDKDRGRRDHARVLERRPHRFIALPASPFTFAPTRFGFDQPSFAKPQRATRSTIPPANDLRRSRTREVVVAVPDDVSDGDTITLGTGLSLEVTVQKRLPLLGMKIVRLRVPEGRDVTQALTGVIERSATDGRILEVQPNFIFETAQAATIGAMKFSVPQYATEAVRLGEAHRIALGRNVRVAVIDTGLDGSHPELSGVSIETFDAIGEGIPASEAHGTAVAGIVAARQQIRGMAPDARVLAVRAFAAGSGQRAEATTLSIINGIHWAIANGARVINMSFVGPKDALLQRAIEAGIAKGVIFVAAAGNGGPLAEHAYPAAYNGVIAVTAIDSNDQLYSMANRGDYIALAAPGVDILAPAPNSAYEMSSGTSLAAAHVSGIIALMLERRPSLSTEEARDILRRTARDPDQAAMANGLGAGIIDAARAVAEIK